MTVQEKDKARKGKEQKPIDASLHENYSQRENTEGRPADWER